MLFLMLMWCSSVAQGAAFEPHDPVLSRWTSAAQDTIRPSRATNFWGRPRLTHDEREARNERIIDTHSRWALYLGVGLFLLLFTMPITSLTVWYLHVFSLLGVFFAARAHRKIQLSSRGHFKAFRRIQVGMIFLLLVMLAVQLFRG